MKSFQGYTLSQILKRIGARQIITIEEMKILKNLLGVEIKYRYRNSKYKKKHFLEVRRLMKSDGLRQEDAISQVAAKYRFKESGFRTQFFRRFPDMLVKGKDLK
jgi:hypothetical protein